MRLLKAGIKKYCQRDTYDQYMDGSNWRARSLLLSPFDRRDLVVRRAIPLRLRVHHHPCAAGGGRSRAGGDAALLRAPCAAAPSLAASVSPAKQRRPQVISPSSAARVERIWRRTIACGRSSAASRSAARSRRSSTRRTSPAARSTSTSHTSPSSCRAHATNQFCGIPSASTLRHCGVGQVHDWDEPEPRAGRPERVLDAVPGGPLGTYAVPSPPRQPRGRRPRRSEHEGARLLPRMRRQ